MISRADIEKLGALSRLHVTEDMMASTEQALNDILGYVATLENLDVEGVAPMAHAVPLTNVLRPDVQEPSIAREAALRNAPAAEAGYFKVPRVVQE